MIWFFLERAGEVPDISVADILWFASYPPIAAALWIALVRGEGRGRVNVDMVVDALTIVVISVLTFWSLSISDIVADPSTPAFVRTVWASYPVADAVVLALVLRVLASPRSRETIDIWFAVGVGLLARLGHRLPAALRRRDHRDRDGPGLDAGDGPHGPLHLAALAAARR